MSDPHSVGIALEHVPEFAPPLRPSQRHRYSLAVSATAPSFAVPAAQPFLAPLSHAPFTGLAMEHVPEFRPPLRPSQRHR